MRLFDREGDKYRSRRPFSQSMELRRKFVESSEFDSTLNIDRIEYRL